MKSRDHISITSLSSPIAPIALSRETYPVQHRPSFRSSVASSVLRPVRQPWKPPRPRLSPSSMKMPSVSAPFASYSLCSYLVSLFVSGMGGWNEMTSQMGRSGKERKRDGGLASLTTLTLTGWVRLSQPRGLARLWMTPAVFLATMLLLIRMMRMTRIADDKIYIRIQLIQNSRL